MRPLAIFFRSSHRMHLFVLPLNIWPTYCNPNFKFFNFKNNFGKMLFYLHTRAANERGTVVKRTWLCVTQLMILGSTPCPGTIIEQTRILITLRYTISKRLWLNESLDWWVIMFIILATVLKFFPVRELILCLLTHR